MASVLTRAQVVLLLSCCIISQAGLGFRLTDFLKNRKNKLSSTQHQTDVFVHRHKRAIIRGQSFRWPTLTDVRGKGNFVIIPYVTDSSLGSSAKQALTEAFKEYKKYTCVRFVTRTNQADYINIFSGQGCYSPIGRQGGKQPLSLGSNCDVRGHVIHELMHAVGFLHEQNRPDRDKYVKILWDNIKTKMTHQFKRYNKEEVTSLGESYDYLSIMHYTDKEFSRNGLKTLESKVEPTSKIGQLHGFSAIDIKQINKLYSCPKIASRGDIYNYKVTVYTGEYLMAGTNARVYINLFGESFDRLLSSGEAEVATGGKRDDFERGSVKTFLTVSPYLGTLKKLTIRHDGSGLFPGWYLVKVIVTDPKNGEVYTFSCNCWLEKSNLKTPLTTS
uniref:Metalloendopeptidase n=1 Tax=Ceriantheomorphe brasiliensis TaxID=1048506 RepID=A0A7G7WYR0_9CNID|nr:toxin candidate TRINITY_DN16138_c0_g1_i1 [Ceriantheomorphe brasiliensis]